MVKIDDKNFKNTEKFKIIEKKGFFKTLTIAVATALTFGLYNSGIKNDINSYLSQKMAQFEGKKGDHYIYLYASPQLKKDLKELESISYSNKKISSVEFKFWKDKFDNHIKEIKLKLDQRIKENNIPYIIANEGLLKAVQENYDFFEKKVLERGLSEK